MVAYITELNTDNYQTFVSKEGLVLIDVWATWCNPCRMISPIIDEVSSEYLGKVSVGKLDADANREIVTELGVRNIPTILLFKNGELVKDENGTVEKLVGAINKQKLVDFIDKHSS
jgi:thioredoxin 1